MGAGWTAGDTLPRRDQEATTSPSSTEDVRWMTLQVEQASSLLHLSAGLQPSDGCRGLCADQPSWVWYLSLMPRGERTHRVVELVALKLMVT